MEAAGFALGAAALTAGAIQLAYATHPVVPLALFGLLGAVALAYARPMYALYASLLMAPLDLVTIPLVGEATLSPAEGMFLITGWVWALRRLAEGEAPYSQSPLSAPLALLVVAILPGLAVAEESFLTVKILLMWTSFFLVFQMMLVEVRPRDLWWLLLSLAVSAAVLGLFAAVSSAAAGGQQLLEGGTKATGRAAGSLGHPNTLGTFEAIALPGALALVLRGRAGFTVVGLACVAAIFTGLSLTLSRGGLLAGAGALLVMLAWRPFRLAAIAGIAIVVVLSLGNANPLGDVQEVNTISQRISSVEAARRVDPRLTIWRATPPLIEDHFLTGVGAAQFPNVIARYSPPDPSTGETFAHAHNIALTVAAELGLLGIAGLVWLVVALTRVLVSACRRPGPTRGAAFAVAAGMFSLALQGLVDYTLRSNVIAALVFVLCGAAVVASRDPDQTAAATAA